MATHRLEGAALHLYAALGRLAQRQVGLRAEQVVDLVVVDLREGVLEGVM